MSGTLQQYEGNLLDLNVEVIVNAANSSLMGGGGVDGVIHRAAGPQLKKACRPLAPCPPGEVRVTPGFGLGDRLVFHTVGPIWKGGRSGEPALLEACYTNCLNELAARNGTNIAFPAISTGAYSYPPDEAAAIAVRVCDTFIKTHDVSVTLATFDRANTAAVAQALRDIGRAPP